jgi:chemotaxis protein CheD
MKERYIDLTQSVRSYHLRQGTIYVSPEECLITTVLGSCIAVCLWDPVSGTGGMNHYMLPLWNADGLPSPRYGNIAIPKLMDKILSLGCEKSNLKAKVFGGAEMLSYVNNDKLRIGNQNIILAEDLLAREGIPIISMDAGGNSGRKIEFNTKTGIVTLKRFKSKLKI